MAVGLLGAIHVESGREERRRSATETGVVPENSKPGDAHHRASSALRGHTAPDAQIRNGVTEREYYGADPTDITHRMLLQRAALH